MFPTNHISLFNHLAGALSAFVSGRSLRTVVMVICVCFIAPGVNATNTQAMNATAASSLRELEECLVRGNEAYQKNEYSAALRHYLNAESHAFSFGDSAKISEVFYNQGIAYFQISAHGRSLEALYKGLEYIPSGVTERDLRLNITYAIAGVFFKDGDNEKALQLIEPLLQEVIREGDDDDYVYLAMFAAMIANKGGNTDEALRLIAESKARLKPEQSRTLAWVLTIESSVLSKTGDDEAIKRIWRTLETIHDASPEDVALVAIFMMQIATK